MLRISFVLAFAGSALCATASARNAEPAYHLVPGSVPMDKGPDGNSVFIDAPDGLILVDTGRHPEHRDKLLAYAKERRRPIAAIVNTHWHLDHTTGNAEVRAAYPRARVYATGALEGALLGFFPNSKKGAEDFIKSGKASALQRAEIERGLYVMDHPDTLRPTEVISSSRTERIAGQKFDIHIARFAATEADLWIYDPQAKLAIVGDLVVDIVPFMDTACAEGWKKALEDVSATPFVMLIPGHGAPMDRAEFTSWKTAFDNFVDCGRSARSKDECVAGWKRDAARFIDAAHAGYVEEAAAYYIDTRLRSSPEEQQKYCRPLRA